MAVFILCDNSTYVVVVNSNNEPKVKYNRTLDDDASNKFLKKVNVNRKLAQKQVNKYLAF